jgi:hypothetical protein
MTQTGDSTPADGLSFAMDQIGRNIHGNADTHIGASAMSSMTAGSTTTGQPSPGSGREIT